LKDVKNRPQDLIQAAYRSALGREPSEMEIANGQSFLTGQADLKRDLLLARHKVATPSPLPEGVDPAEASALADFCLALLNANEFIYID
jgi:hypothetical protein